MSGRGYDERRAAPQGPAGRADRASGTYSLYWLARMLEAGQG